MYIGGTNVPEEYVREVEASAKATGIPAAIVAAQIDLESGFNPSAESPTGAQGIAQFEPATWRAYGSGSPDNPTDAFAAYRNYMGTLMHEFHGNITDALAAYNAGPGNIGAGMQYARTVENNSGSDTRHGNPEPITKSNPTGSSTGGTNHGKVKSLITFPIGFVSFFDDLVKLFEPSNLVRIGSGVVGLILAGVALLLFSKFNSGTAVSAGKLAAL